MTHILDHMRYKAMRVKFLSLLIGVCSGLILLAASSSVSAQTQKFPIAESNNEWYVENADRIADGKFSDVAGRRALMLRNGTQVVRNNVEFTDGTIEFDLAPTDTGNFVALVFRRESLSNHENVYFRIHRSGTYNALQYAPRINGSSTWQLYPEFNSTINLPRNQWTRVRVEVIGLKLEIFINGDAKPALSVLRLRRTIRGGTVGFWARVNDKPTEWATGIANVSIRRRTTTEPVPIPVEKQNASALTDWEASDAGPADAAIKILPATITNWKAAMTEENGLVNLNRLFTTTRGRRTAFARTIVQSAQARSAKLAIGYSDEVRVYVNGEFAYHGINGFESRHPEYMGFVKPEFESVQIKLRPGKNEIVFAVTDDQRFGWGFIANLIGEP